MHANLSDISCTVLIHRRLEDADSIIKALQHNTLLCNLVLDNNPCAMHSPRIHAALGTMAEAPAANPASAADSLTRRLAFGPSSTVAAASRPQDALAVLRLMLLRQQVELQQHRHRFLTSIAVRINLQNVTFGGPSQYDPFSACVSQAWVTLLGASQPTTVSVSVSAD